MQDQLSKLFGANFRTTLTNLVALLFATATAIAAAPSELDILPSSLYPYRGRIIAICGVIAFLSRLLNGQFQKDKTVTGGTTQQTISGNVAEPGTQSLVDETVKASIKSGEPVTPDQRRAVNAILPLLAAMCIPVFLFGGCASLPANATAQQKAQAAIDAATIGAKYAVSPAVTGWLLLQKDRARQQKDAAMVYAGTTALNSMATGAVPTPVELQVIISSFFGSADPRYVQLAQLLSAEYGTLFPLFRIAGSSPAKFFAEVALQAGNAAKPFLAPPA